jgi:hypothetical protein
VDALVEGSESQSGTLGQVQKSRLLGTQNFGYMNPWSLRSLPPLRPVCWAGRKMQLVVLEMPERDCLKLSRKVLQIGVEGTGH